MSKNPSAPARGKRSGGAAATTSPRRYRQWWGRDQLVIEFRGGPEASYTLRIRGRTWRYSGHDSLHDVMTHAARNLL